MTPSKEFLREELFDWLDPSWINYPPDDEQSTSTLLSAMNFLCNSEWEEVTSFCEEHDICSEELSQEAACIIVEHFVRVMLRNYCLRGYKPAILKELMGFCAKELMND